METARGRIQQCLAAILDRGCVLARGNPAEICNNPEVRTKYLGEEFEL